MNSLQILKKIRKYELEKEEHALMLQHQEVQIRQQRLQSVERKLQSDLAAKESFKTPALLRHFDTHFSESEKEIQIKKIEHQQSLQNRDLQIQKTLLMKQRHDMIDRVLDHRRDDLRAEEERHERKFLDDISQTRYAMGTPS